MLADSSMFYALMISGPEINDMRNRVMNGQLFFAFDIHFSVTSSMSFAKQSRTLNF